MPRTKKKKLIEVRLNKPNKFEARREHLAESTLSTMGKKGYANTSMRDIAADAGVSLGTLHYYFVDKSELLSYCVKTFKRAFIQKVIDQCEAADNLKDLITTFIDVCCDSMITDYQEHRVWFDIRSQALYEPIFAPLRVEIENELGVMFRTFIVAGEQYSGHTSPMKTDAVGWMVEGLFEAQLFNFIHTGDAALAKRGLKRDMRDFCGQLFPTKSVRSKRH
jgi:AcrR family transcriptional regulator